MDYTQKCELTHLTVKYWYLAEELTQQSQEQELVIYLDDTYENPVKHINFKRIRTQIELTLDKTSFFAMNSMALQAFKCLNKLVIHHSRIQKLEAYCFKGLPYLHTLDIQFNHNLTEIEPKAFDGCMRLRELCINQSPLSLASMHVDTFKGLTHLRVLKLYHFDLYIFIKSDESLQNKLFAHMKKMNNIALLYVIHLFHVNDIAKL